MTVLWVAGAHTGGAGEVYQQAGGATAEESEDRLGILGGTFDPPHTGHLVIAEAAREALRLRKVLFVAARVQPLKIDREVAPAADRWEMVILAVEGNEAFEACDLELRRDGPSYTADSVAELKRMNPGSRLYFICGSDALEEMASWHEPQRILANAVVAVAERPGTGPPASTRESATELTQRLGGTVLGFPAPQIEISSTLIREMAARGESVRYLVPEKVFGFIRKRRLYSGGIRR